MAGGLLKKKIIIHIYGRVQRERKREGKGKGKDRGVERLIDQQFLTDSVFHLTSEIKKNLDLPF